MHENQKTPPETAGRMRRHTNASPLSLGHLQCSASTAGFQRICSSMQILLMKAYSALRFVDRTQHFFENIISLSTDSRSFQTTPCLCDSISLKQLTPDVYFSGRQSQGIQKKMKESARVAKKKNIWCAVSTKRKGTAPDYRAITRLGSKSNENRGATLVQMLESQRLSRCSGRIIERFPSDTP